MQIMKIIYVCIFVLDATLAKICDVSTDCDDPAGRSLCYQKTCRRDVPCNKDNDCFFYGASDVSKGQPHPKCYINNKVASLPMYGICMMKELAGNLKRLHGIDVVDVAAREVNKENIISQAISRMKNEKEKK